MPQEELPSVCEEKMGKRQGWEAESTEEQRKYMRMRMYSLL
jgi:hypothetical protein